MESESYNSKIVLASGEVLIDLTGDTVEAGKLLSGTTAHDKSGAPVIGSCTYDSDTSDDTMTASELLLGKTGHARGIKITGSMPNNGSVAGTISAKDATYIVPQGYHDGAGSVGIDPAEKAKLVAANIRQGVTILGVEGTMSGSESVVAQEKSVTPSFAQQVVSPDEGYTHLSNVTVAAIPVTYTENAAGGITVTIG